MRYIIHTVDVLIFWPLVMFGRTTILISSKAAGSEHRQCAGETYRDTRQMFVFHASVNKCQTQDIRWSEMMVVLHLSVFHYSVCVYRQDCMYLLISTELFVYLCCRSREK